MIPEKFKKQIEAEAERIFKKNKGKHGEKTELNRQILLNVWSGGGEFAFPIAQAHGEEIGEARMAKKMIEFLNSKEYEQIGIKHTSEGKHWAKIIEKHFTEILKKAEGRG